MRKSRADGATSPIDNIELALHVSDIGDTPAPFTAPQAEILIDRRRKLELDR